MTDHDHQHCTEVWESLQDPCDSPDCQPPDDSWPACDCRSSEIVVLSTGYAEVWFDGDVIQYGKIIANVAE